MRKPCSLMAAPRPAERGPAAAFWSDDEVLRLLEAVGLDAALPNNAFGGVKLSATHDAFRDRHARFGRTMTSSSLKGGGRPLRTVFTLPRAVGRAGVGAQGGPMPV